MTEKNKTIFFKKCNWFYIYLSYFISFWFFKQRQKKKTFINPKVVLGTSPPTAGTFTMKSLVGAVLAEASSVEQDVHPYGRGNMYTNAFSGKRSLVHLDPAKLMFWGIVVCLVTGAAFGVIILSGEILLIPGSIARPFFTTLFHIYFFSSFKVFIFFRTFFALSFSLLS